MTFISRRLEQVPTYFFTQVADQITARRAQGVDVINLGVGDPDLPTPDWIIEALHQAALDPANHRYPSYFGLPRLRQAVAAYYHRRFGVELDPAREVLPLLGSKEGIAHAGLAWTNPDDVVLVPDPGYPVYAMSARLAGAEPYPVPLRANDGHLPDLDRIPAGVLGRARVLWLNYPNNPTGATAPLEFFERAVAFARRHNLLIAHDNPYCDVSFDGYVAPSILQVPNAHQVAVEFNSLSKTYNMAGWRIGMAVGNREALATLAHVKSNMDTGIPNAIQHAAIAALEGDQSWLAGRNAVYQRRRDLLVEGLRAAGLECTSPRATLYIWARIPGPCDSALSTIGQTLAPRNEVSAGFARRLLDEVGVWLTPGTAYGKQGEGYLRASLSVPDHRLAEATQRLHRVAFTSQLPSIGGDEVLIKRYAEVRCPSTSANT
jgi:LL-diaminopimelate aminotransferase